MPAAAASAGSAEQASPQVPAPTSPRLTAPLRRLPSDAGERGLAEHAQQATPSEVAEGLEASGAARAEGTGALSPRCWASEHGQRMADAEAARERRRVAAAAERAAARHEPQRRVVGFELP